MRYLYTGGCYYGPKHRALLCWGSYPELKRHRIAFRLMRPIP